MVVALIREQSPYSPGIEVVPVGQEKQVQGLYNHLATLAIGINQPIPPDNSRFYEKYRALQQLEESSAYDMGCLLFRKETYDSARNALQSIADEELGYGADTIGNSELIDDISSLDDYLLGSDYELVTEHYLAANTDFKTWVFPMEDYLSAHESELLTEDDRLKVMAIQYEVSDRLSSYPDLQLEDMAHTSIGRMQQGHYEPLVTVLNKSYLADRQAAITSQKD